MNWKRTLFICLIILLAGAGITALIFMTEPTAKRSGATKETAMLVEVVGVQKGDFRPEIKVAGTVQAAQDIILSPRVNGEIIRCSPAFVPGGIVKKGQVLLQIDPADYENTLQMRKSDLHQALADLDLEKGQQEVARRDYQFLGDSLSPANESLVLREPQLHAVQASVEAAEAMVKQAELNLQRTTIRAPFDGQVITRNANVGSQVSPGMDLGRLVGVDQYWVVANVPLAQLHWLSFPDGSGTEASEVKITNQTAWPKGAYRTGQLYRMLGALEPQTRLARVLITVPDPLAYRSESADTPAMIIGTFVEVEIKARTIPEAIRLERDYLRKDDTVWLMEDGELRIREVDVLFRDAQYAYLTGGLTEDDQIVTTNLTTVVNGAPLRTASPEAVSNPDTLAGRMQADQIAIPTTEANVK